ncbi:MAG TPA: transposase [Minicystis sp.]|nr:transposase [Minicystis sp.]
MAAAARRRRPPPREAALFAYIRRFGVGADRALRRRMSSPRQITPGATYLVSRRVLLRQFLLRPSAEINGIFVYCLAYAASRTEVEIHGFCAMSNHWHGVVTDPKARLPEFLQMFHRLVAVAVNASLGRVENVWACEPTSVVRLESADDVLDKLAYMAANPVAAGLVSSPAEWPGAMTTGLGNVLTATRPKHFFSARGRMPATVTLVCTLPKMLDTLGLDVARRRLRTLVQAYVRRARMVMRAQRRPFAGAASVRSAPITTSAASPEPMRQLKPSIASKDRERRIEALRRIRAFRYDYRIALDRWRNGDRGVRFPSGTYRMRVLHGVCCGPPPI